jgi:hypothetical protein
MMGKNRTVVMVLGTPRSGTSALTRMLPVFGIRLGDDLVSPNLNNPVGFWEDVAIQRINARLLELAGRHLGWPVFRRERVEPSVEYAGLLQEARRLLREKLGNDEVWAFKDPRANRLLFFWQRVFADLNCQDRYILALRNPASVARSLVVSSGLKPATGLALWLECTVQAVQDTLGKPLVVVAYERLLADTHREILRVAQELGMEERLEEEEMVYYEGQFIDGTLQHVDFSREELVRVAKDLPLAVDVYDWLCQRAADEIGEEEFRRGWDCLYVRYRVEYPAFVAANPWLGERRGISVADMHRIYLRISYHGSAEIWRLARRVVDKVLLEV